MHRTRGHRTAGAAYDVLLALVVLAGAAAAGVALWAWFAAKPAVRVAVNLPGADGRPEGAGGWDGTVNLEGRFERFDGVPADLPGAWPRFRGEDYDNIVADGPPLAASWDEAGPPVLWTVALGEGHAGPAVLNGRVYVIDYDEDARADAIRCFSLADGAEIWRRSYEVAVKRNHGMSRTVPAVTDRYVVTMGPRCHVVCLDAASGDFRWGFDLVAKFGAEEPLWYTGQCPLIDGGQAILAPCGPDALLMAVDCETGEIAWKTPNPKGWKMSHSSIIPMTLCGVRTYVYCALGALVGVAADGPHRGRVLWELPVDARVIAPSPVPVGGDRVFMTAGYGFGSVLARIVRGPEGLRAEEVFRKSPKEGLACEQQTPIYADGRLFAVMPKDAGALREQFVCYDVEGGVVWASGPDERFGLGPFVLAGGVFYVLSGDGVLTAVRADADAYGALSQARVLEGPDAWGPIAVAGTRMLMRDSKHMICLDMAPEPGGDAS